VVAVGNQHIAIVYEPDHDERLTHVMPLL